MPRSKTASVAMVKTAVAFCATLAILAPRAAAAEENTSPAENAVTEAAEAVADLPAMRVIYRTDTPANLLRTLYFDVSGILRPPHAPVPQPLWWHFLSANTAEMLAAVQQNEAARGKPAFATDWLCQCDRLGRYQMPGSILIQDANQARAYATVSLVFPGGEIRRLHITLVNEDGWKIDEMTNDWGRTLTGELADALRLAAADRTAPRNAQTP